MGFLFLDLPLSLLLVLLLLRVVEPASLGSGEASCEGEAPL